MNMIPFDVRNYIETKPNQKIVLDVIAPYETLHGYTIQNLVPQTIENLLSL
jgi:hypothetical protein